MIECFSISVTETNLVEMAEKVEQMELSKEQGAQARSRKKKSQKQRRGDQAMAAMQKKLKQ